MIGMPDIKDDLARAAWALDAEEHNLGEFGDFFTAANRAFVACESTVYAYLGKVLGNAPKSRARLQANLSSLRPELKRVYDQSYDLRVQADYGRASRFILLNKENVRNTLNKIKLFHTEISRMIEESVKK